jgi:hypothetical protein
MNYANLKTLTLATFLVAMSVATSAAVAQNAYPQPYNPNDPQNYQTPAAQSYANGQSAPPQLGQYANQYPQQGQYQGQQMAPNGYPQGQYPQGQYQGQQGQYQDQQQQGGYAGQEQVMQPPPPLPQYDQPPAPGDGYIWTPGYWAFGPGGYHWVPGAWVVAPYDGALWTPGYWGYGDGFYFWNAGYWGPVVGFYGGINYGFGYFGSGFYGGYWNRGHFFYNREYVNVGFGIHNFYNQRFPGVATTYRPGGASFASVNARGQAFSGFRGGSYAGAAYAPHNSLGAGNGFANGGIRTDYGRPAGGYSAPVARPYNTAPASSYGRSYAPAVGSRAPASGSYTGSGAGHFSAPSGGGGFHGSSGGGGGSRGGGGGGRR